MVPAQTDPMTDLLSTSREHLRATHDSARSRYDAFAARGVKLDLTRGKPASAQLDLSAALLALPGESDYLAADGTDTRNYGVLQGLLELRAVLAPLFGVDPQQTVIGDNSSLGLMHDTIAYALLCGTCDGPGPWSKRPRVAFLCPVPGYDRHFAICQDFGIEMIPVPMTDAGPDIDVVERLVADDDGIRGMWCMPKYSNPTGTVYSDQTVERLAAMTTAAPDFRLFWDNAYAVHHLTAERIEIANIVTACASARTCEPAVRVRIHVQGHPGRRRRRALRVVAAERRLVPEANGQAHHRRRQDQPASPRAVPSRYPRAAGVDGRASRRDRAEVRDGDRDVSRAPRGHAVSPRGPNPRAAISSAWTCSTAARRRSSGSPSRRASS